MEEESVMVPLPYIWSHGIVILWTFCFLEKTMVMKKNMMPRPFLFNLDARPFMKRVEADGYWHLFCPNECPGLSDLVGDEFERKYVEYEAGGLGTKVKAREIWYAILESQIETGTPYICYKDASNIKSNQQNLGVIKSSNLCTEIIEYSSSTESAVCNLASIGLSNFVVFDPVELDYTNIKVNSVENCKYCKMSKELLETNGFKYDETIYETAEDKKQFMDELNVAENISLTKRVKHFHKFILMENE